MFQRLRLTCQNIPVGRGECPDIALKILRTATEHPAMHYRDLATVGPLAKLFVARRKETNCCDKACTCSFVFDLWQTCGA